VSTAHNAIAVLAQPHPVEVPYRGQSPCGRPRLRSPSATYVIEQRSWVRGRGRLDQLEHMFDTATVH
jgi:hypothetical protein